MAVSNKERVFSIRPDALVVHQNGVFIEARGRAEPFCIALGPRLGWALFAPVVGSNGVISRYTFELREMHPAHAEAPARVVSWSGVLWHRQVAIEAHQARTSYLRGQDAIR